MRKEWDADIILLNLRVKPDAAAKREARERMLACRAGLSSAADGKGVYELTDDELELAAAAGYENGLSVKSCRAELFGQSVDGYRQCATYGSCGVACKCECVCKNGWHPVYPDGDKDCI